MDSSLRCRPGSGPGAAAGLRGRREDDALAAQDLHSAGRQDPRHEHPGVRQEDRRRGDDPNLHLRRHVDEVHGGHREQDAAGRGGAGRGGAGAARQPGPALGRLGSRGHGDEGARRAGPERRGRRQVQRQVLRGAALRDSSDLVLPKGPAREGERPAARHVGSHQRDLRQDQEGGAPGFSPGLPVEPDGRRL